MCRVILILHFASSVVAPAPTPLRLAGVLAEAVGDECVRWCVVFCGSRDARKGGGGGRAVAQTRARAV
eukprot:1778952-Rhodomonas_salina.4